MESTQIDESLEQEYPSEETGIKSSSRGGYTNYHKESLDASLIEICDETSYEKLKAEIKEKNTIREDKDRYISELKALVNNLMTQLLR